MKRREFLAAAAGLPMLAGAAPTESQIKAPRFEPYRNDKLEPRADFWKVRPQEIIERCRTVQKGRAEIIAHTPLGYPIYAVFYGDFNEPPPQTNWSAGSSSTTWRNFTGDRKDGKQTFLFVAGVHGAEAETVAGAMNVIQLLETGRDYRGKEDPALVDLVSKYRFIIVPCGNMDGRSISPDHLRGLDFHDFRVASQGVWKDQSLVGWRGSKAWFPLPLDRVAYPGGYPNADGYNIMHDAAPGDIRTAEARALLKLAARWRVDAVLNGHSYEYAPSILPPSSLDLAEKAERGLDIRLRVNQAIYKAGLTPRVPTRGEARPSHNLNTMFSLSSGALALTLESSVSFDRPIKPPKVQPTRSYTFEELMEPTFIALREYLADGLERPFLNRGDDKVKPD